MWAYRYTKKPLSYDELQHLYKSRLMRSLTWRV